MRNFNVFILVLFITINGKIGAQFSPKISLKRNFRQIVYDPDLDACSSQKELFECFGEMQKAVKMAGAGPNEGLSLSMSVPNNKEKYNIACSGAAAFAKCADEKNLRQICAKDPIFVQVDGTLGYMCQEPQRTGKKT